MENNINDIRDEIIEFPSNYEEIANQELLNFEKNNKIDLNTLIIKSLEHDKNIINKKNNINLDENNNNKNEWEDYESDEEDEEKISCNNYQKFEDDDCTEDIKEEQNEILKSNKIEKILNNKNNCDNCENKFSNIKSINKNEHILDKNLKEKRIINNKEIHSKTNKKKLTNEEMKNMIIKINYNPPNWARNLSDQEFINKIQSFKK